MSHGHQSCFTSLVGLVDKTDSCPFSDSPKRTHTGFDCKVNRPTVNFERQVQRHRTTDSPRLFFHHPPHITDTFMNSTSCSQTSCTRICVSNSVYSNFVYSCFKCDEHSMRRASLCHAFYVTCILCDVH